MSRSPKRKTSAKRPPARRSETAAPGFDITAHLWRLCHDISGRLPDLAHIRMDQVAVTFCQTRRQVLHGLQAKLTPLRFENGSLHQTKRGRTYTIERVYDQQGREMLYLLSFYLPRFLQHCTHHKFVTVFHELLHISPQFDGDLRRFPGRCYAHTGSQKNFDAQAEQLYEAYLALDPPEELLWFLQMEFDELVQQHGPIKGLKLRTPKLIPVDGKR